MIRIPLNEWDRDNLNFLLNADRKTLDEWYEQCDADDIRYALELMKAHKSELIMQELEYFDEVSDVAMANTLLKKFGNA